MMAVSRFIDWNPAHFLDVTEMTMGMAIGYDWLFDDLSPDARKNIRDAILNKGINPSKISDYNSWLRSRNNCTRRCFTPITW